MANTTPALGTSVVAPEARPMRNPSTAESTTTAATSAAGKAGDVCISARCACAIFVSPRGVPARGVLSSASSSGSPQKAPRAKKLAVPPMNPRTIAEVLIISRGACMMVGTSSIATELTSSPAERC
eukprot:3807019-Prymnesium_polylepis.2